MTELQKLYADCAYYMCGKDASLTAKSIIDKAVDVLRMHSELVLEDVWAECLWHKNNWNNRTIRELIEEEDWIVEDLLGALGEYYAGR